MKITGLITEYNPFHNGHLYHLTEAKRLTEADYCVALMSGSFVQRGAPAVFDKYLRTRMALSCGVDLVLELPVSFSTASAREFASYGIALFTAVGADGICFGSESGQLELLEKAAALLGDEPGDFKNRLRDCLKRGLTFPEARSRALLPNLSPDEQELFSSPNNILGIEYLRAAREQKSHLSFATVRRLGAGYHDEAVSGISHASARAIRRLLMDGSRDAQPAEASFTEADGLKNSSQESRRRELRSQLPGTVWDLMQGAVPVFSDDLSAMLNYRILAGDGAVESIADMTPELASRLRKTALPPCTFEERARELKTRQITYTRVSRALLHLLLGITGEETALFKANGYAPYARVLGFRKDALPLLTELKKRAQIPLVTKLADAPSLLAPVSLAMINREIEASHLYQLAASQKGCEFKNEFTRQIAVI